MQNVRNIDETWAFCIIFRIRKDAKGFDEYRRRLMTLMTAQHWIMAGPGDDAESSVVVSTRPKPERPPLYKVVLLNDDYTPMEFVVAVLERIFHLSSAQSFEIMLTVHNRGAAVVGVFSYEIAEMKVTQVMDFARAHEHPLQCMMERE